MSENTYEFAVNQQKFEDDLVAKKLTGEPEGTAETETPVETIEQPVDEPVKGPVDSNGYPA